MATFALNRTRSGRHRRINPRVWIAVGVALVVFVAAIVGYVIGQAGHTTATTATSTVPPAAGPAPVNTHTKTGAASAAATSIEKLYGAAFVYPQTRDAALESIADPAKLATLKDQLHGQLQIFNDATHFDAIVKGGTPAVSVMRVLAPPQVSDYTDQTAQVRMWVMDILGTAGGSPPRVGWNIATVTVRWVNTAWKVDAVTLETGPAPAPDLDGNPPTDAGSFVAEIDQLQGVSR